MTTLFIIFGALILAVTGRAFLDPLLSRGQSPIEAPVVAEQQAQMMQAIALSVF